MNDEDIDFSDLPEATPEMLARAVLRPGLKVTEPKEELKLKLDRDLAKWFRSLGSSYQSVINLALRKYMQEELRRPARSRARRA